MPQGQEGYSEEVREPQVQQGAENPMLAKMVVQRELIRRVYERATGKTLPNDKEEASKLLAPIAMFWMEGEHSPALQLGEYVDALYQEKKTLDIDPNSNDALDAWLDERGVTFSAH